MGETIFAEMSALAARTGSVNLGQGFPDTDGPTALLEAAVDALRDYWIAAAAVDALRAGRRVDVDATTPTAERASTGAADH